MIDDMHIAAIESLVVQVAQQQQDIALLMRTIEKERECNKFRDAILTSHTNVLLELVDDLNENA